MFQAQNRETINSIIEKLLCPSRSLWRRAWQDRVSQHNTKAARPRPRSRSIIFFLSETGGFRPHHWYEATEMLSVCVRVAAACWQTCVIVRRTPPTNSTGTASFLILHRQSFHSVEIHS